jgi:conjugal transfer pilus assembly protein TraK
VFIANADVEHPRPVGETWPAGLSPQDASARLIAAMYAQKPVEGFDITWRALVPVNIDTLVVQMVGQYVGASYTGKLIKITNRGTKPAALTEDKVAPADAIAVSITNPRLAPGEATTAFIVQRSADAGGQP